MLSKGRILIVYPSSSPDNPRSDDDFESNNCVPIGVLSLASYLEEASYEVRIIDCRLYPKKDCLDMIRVEVKKSPICVGISATTPQVKHGLQITDFVKSMNKDMPIVWGGIHPILFPKQTIADEHIDYVVTGEGEFTFFDLINHLKTDEPKLENIKGLAYKKDDQIHINELCQPLSMDELPAPAYHLLDIERYLNRAFITHGGEIKRFRALDVHTSRGCPYQCTFCANLLPVFKRWRPLKMKEVLKRLDAVIKKYNLEHVWIMDDFFFADKKRVEEIARFIINKDYDITWEANARANLFNEQYLNNEFLNLLKQSGCFCLRMGMESGSNRILEMIKKNITTDQIINSVKECEKHGIIPMGSFMCGLPTETNDEIVMTGRLILNLKTLSPNGLFYSPGLFRPYPGGELYEMCKQLGYKEPKTLREWANKHVEYGFYMDTKDLPWIKYPEWLKSFQLYLHLALVLESNRLLDKKISLPWLIFGSIAKWRILNNFWFLPLDAKLLMLVRGQTKKSGGFSKFLKSIAKPAQEN